MAFLWIERWDNPDGNWYNLHDAYLWGPWGEKHFRKHNDISQFFNTFLFWYYVFWNVVVFCTPGPLYLWPFWRVVNSGVLNHCYIIVWPPNSTFPILHNLNKNIIVPFSWDCELSHICKVTKLAFIYFYLCLFFFTSFPVLQWLFTVFFSQLCSVLEYWWN